MKPSTIILDAITVPDVSTLELIRLASVNGYGGVSLWVHAPVDTLPIPIMRAGSKEIHEARSALDDAGLIANGVEVFDISGSASRDDVRHALEAAAELGAKTATAVCFLPLEAGELAERLAAMAEDAAANDQWISIEFMAPALAGELNSLPRAVEIMELTGMPNVGITMDMLHLTRTGATLDQIEAVPAERIRYVQLCDGPATMAPADQLAEAGFGRQYPGEGDFAIREMLAALPDGKPVGLEIPRSGLDPEDIARDAMRAARDFLDPTPAHG